MVNTSCSVGRCPSSATSARTDKTVKFHQFPRTEERCAEWVKFCRRDYLLGRSCESLKHSHICSLHFPPTMYGRKSLKKTAIPMLFPPPPPTASIQTQTEPELFEEDIYTEDYVGFYCTTSQIPEDIDKKSYARIDCTISKTSEDINTKSCVGIDRSTSQIPEDIDTKSYAGIDCTISKTSEDVNTKSCVGIDRSTSQIPEDIDTKSYAGVDCTISKTSEDINTKSCVGIDRSTSPIAEDVITKNVVRIDFSSQTPVSLTDYISRKRKLTNPLSTTSKKKLKLKNERCKDITKEQFLKSCDKFLTPKLSAIVKAQIHLAAYRKDNRNAREFKLFCLNLYYPSPIAYRTLSKTFILPSKSMLAHTYVPVGTKINKQMWDFLTATIKHMSASEKECVLCMDEMSLKLNLSYDTKEDKILGLHEVDGNQQPIAARYALTLMLRGMISSWSQPIGFSFTYSNKIDDALTEWIINTAKHLLQLGFNIRALVSNPGSDFLALSKTLGISDENSCFEIDGHKLYYMFDVPHLVKSVRDYLIKYNFELEGNLKFARWDDIVNIYQQEKTKNTPSVRLTDAHIQPNNVQKQKVRLAVQIFSDSVVTALNNYKWSGTLEISNGTILFVETMNYLLDLLNSTNIDSPKPFKKPYADNIKQEDMLDKAQHLLNSLKVRNKINGLDVTNNVKFINAFNVTINSFRQLHKDMKSEDYDNILPRSIENDCLDNFFGYVRLISGNSREPTCSQFVKAFRKMFLWQILNLSDATNHTRDFENTFDQYINFTTSMTQAILPPKKVAKQTEKFEIPEKNVFQYICGYLFRRSVSKHKRHCESILNYVSSYADKCNENRPLADLPVPGHFVSYISNLENKFKETKYTSFTEENISFNLLQQLRYVDFRDEPCGCFPRGFLLKLFVRMRILHIIQVNNRNFDSDKTKNIKYLSVAHL